LKANTPKPDHSKDSQYIHSVEASNNSITSLSIKPSSQGEGQDPETAKLTHTPTKKKPKASKRNKLQVLLSDIMSQNNNPSESALNISDSNAFSPLPRTQQPKKEDSEKERLRRERDQLKKELEEIKEADAHNISGIRKNTLENLTSTSLLNISALPGNENGDSSIFVHNLEADTIKKLKKEVDTKSTDYEVLKLRVGEIKKKIANLENVNKRISLSIEQKRITLENEETPQNEPLVSVGNNTEYRRKRSNSSDENKEEAEEKDTSVLALLKSNELNQEDIEKHLLVIISKYEKLLTEKRELATELDKKIRSKLEETKLIKKEIIMDERTEAFLHKRTGVSEYGMFKERRTSGNVTQKYIPEEEILMTLEEMKRAKESVHSELQIKRSRLIQRVTLKEEQRKAQNNSGSFNNNPGQTSNVIIGVPSCSTSNDIIVDGNYPNEVTYSETTILKGIVIDKSSSTLSYLSNLKLSLAKELEFKSSLLSNLNESVFLFELQQHDKLEDLENLKTQNSELENTVKSERELLKDLSLKYRTLKEDLLFIRDKESEFSKVMKDMQTSIVRKKAIAKNKISINSLGLKLCQVKRREFNACCGLLNKTLELNTSGPSKKSKGESGRNSCNSSINSMNNSGGGGSISAQIKEKNKSIYEEEQSIILKMMSLSQTNDLLESDDEE